MFKQQSISISQYPENIMKTSNLKTIVIALILIALSYSGYSEDTDLIKTLGMGRLNCIALSPDGTKLASAGACGYLYLWDVESAKLVDTFKIRMNTKFMRISPDGTKFIINYSSKSIPSLLDFQLGTFIGEFAGSLYDTYPFSEAFSPDGKTIAVIYTKAKMLPYIIALWDINSMKLLDTFNIDNHVPSNYYIISFSPDGKKLASISSDNTITIWDLHKKNINKILVANTSYLNSLDFSNDGKRIVCSGYILNVFDVETGEILLELSEVQSPKKALFSHDGSKIAAAGWDSNVVIWDANTGKVLKKLKLYKDNNYYTDLFFSPDDKELYFASDYEEIKAFDVETGLEIRSYEGDSHLNPIAFRNDSKEIVYSENTNEIFVRNIITDSIISNIDIKDGYNLHINKAFLLPDGNTLACWNKINEVNKNKIEFFDLLTGKRIAEIVPDSSVILSMDFSPNKQFLVISGYLEGTDDLIAFINIYKSITLELIKSIKIKDELFDFITISNDGGFVATNNRLNNFNYLMDVKTEEVVYSFFDVNINFSFSNNGRYLAINNQEKGIFIYDIKLSSLNVISSIKHSKQVIFSNDDKFLLACNTEYIHLIDYQNNNTIKAFYVFDNSLLHFIMSSDGTKLASSIDNGTIKIWNVPKYSSVEENHSNKTNESIFVSPNPAGNDYVELTFFIAKPGAVEITLHNLLGDYSQIIHSSYYENSGSHSVSFNSGNLAAGMYFCTLKTMSGVITSKFVVVK